jgi:arylsulfatase A-like enzyme
MKRLLFGVQLLIAAAGFAADRPNIVFIFSDDHALQAMGAYPSWLHDFIETNHVTPNLDRLAQDGLVFANSFCGNSICSPSRATVLTGKHSHLNGVTKWQKFDGSQTTFPKLLQKAGYQTAIIGKWHLISDPTGFDYWEVLPAQGDYYNPDFLTSTGRVHRAGYVTDIITDLALNWADHGRQTNRPFMLMIQNKAPHRTWMPAPKYLTWLDQVTVPEPATFLDDYSTRKAAARNKMEVGRDLQLSYDLKVDPPKDHWPTNKAGKPARPYSYARLTPQQAAAWEEAYEPRYRDYEKLRPTGVDRTHWNFQCYMKDYLRCIKSVDDNVGRVLDFLKQAGLDRNTIVIYSSDQGFYLGEHGWFDKRWMYEESFRMPLIVKWPGVTQPGSRPAQFVQNIDYAPTFLDLAGVTAPAEMQGVSLVPLLRGQNPAGWRTDLYYHYYDGPGEHGVAVHEGVRTARYKLLHFYRAGEWELFDLEKDSAELRNVAADPAYAPVLAEMKARLAADRTRYKLPPLTMRDPDEAAE